MADDRAQILITAVDQTRAAFDSIRANLGRLGEEVGHVKGLLAELGVALSVLGFVEFVKHAIDAGDELSKLSQKIGISVEALSTLRFAAQLSDVSLESLQKGIKGLSQAIAEANSGVGNGAEVFEALGISVKNADGGMKSTDEVLLQVAEVFSHLEDGAVKTTLAVKLFGKSGMDMIPFLNQGAAGIRQLQAEAERLGLKLTGETARSAEAFNDNLTALKASVSGLGIALARDFLPELTTITNAMREAANEAGTLKALWVGLGGVGNLIFNGTEIKQARDEIKRLQDLVDSTRQKVETGKAPLPFTPFDIKFNDAAMATLRKNLAQWENELAAARARLQALTAPEHPEVKAPTGKPTEDMQRIACVVSGGQWINGKCEKKAAGGDKDATGARLAAIKAEAEAEFAVTRQGLAQASAAQQRALDDRLVSIKDFYAAKTALDQAAIDQEINARRQELAAQSKVAVSGQDEPTRLRARAELKKLEGEITVLAMRRGEVEVANAHEAAKAEKELADQLAQVRDRLSELRGGGGDVTRERLMREYQPLIDRLQAMGDRKGVADVGRLIDVEADTAELAKLEREYQVVTERMSIRERELQVQKDAGMITETQMRRGVLDLHRQTAAEVEALIPKMQALAAATGSDEAVNRVARLKVELEALKTQADDVATRIDGDVESAFTTMFEQIGTGAKTAKDAFLDFARSVLAAINKIAAQKLAEELFGGAKGGGGSGGSLGSLVSGFFQWAGFAAGGYVSGPGTSTSDSVPARLSAGEYVLRADAVRRLGVNLLHALNGGAFAPRFMGPRLAFAEGGLVPPAAAPAGGQPLRIVNVIDPALAADYLNSSQGEKTILNLLSRNAGAVKHLIAGG